MNFIVKYSLFFIITIFCSCGTPQIDEKYAITVVKNNLSVNGNITAQKLSGGFSGAKLFVVSSESNKYVVRFINNKPQKYRDLEIYNLKIASNTGYGPQIYFADSSSGIIIMEYLSGKKISDQDLQSDQFYFTLAHFLRKIHHGPAFKNSEYNVFERINNRIQKNKSKYSSYIPLSKIEYIITVIHKALKPHQINTVPCHNDLHCGNIIYTGNEFKAIDYENAGQGDPYFDLATVLSSLHCKQAHEKILLATYLGRPPSAIEEAKIYFMKQVILIKWALNFLNRLSPEYVNKYELIQATPFKDLEKLDLEGKLDIGKPENQLNVLKAHLSKVLENFESQEFRNAVNTLTIAK